MYKFMGLKNPWVYGYGYYTPRPTPANPLGSFLPRNKPMGREIHPYPYPNRAKPQQVSCFGFWVPAAIFNPDNATWAYYT